MKHPRWPNTIAPILIGQRGRFSVKVYRSDDDIIWEEVTGEICDVFPCSIGLVLDKNFFDWDAKVELWIEDDGFVEQDCKILEKL